MTRGFLMNGLDGTGPARNYSAGVLSRSPFSRVIMWIT
jgi:hypothetical protein